MEKRIIRLTESELRGYIAECVKRRLTEGWNSNLSPEALDDKAYMQDRFAEREKMMSDYWEEQNRRLRRKYPHKSEEWYEAMLDTFFENKKAQKTMNESEEEDDEPDYGALHGDEAEYFWGKKQRLGDKYPNKSKEWYRKKAEQYHEGKKSQKTINEIGDTPKGNFALNAVRGRAIARPRYQNDKYGSVDDKMKQSRIASDASDKAWDNYTKNPNLGFHNEAGYNYGYSKGMEEGANEEEFLNNQGYSHFAVNKVTNKIVNGWDYSDYDPSELRQFKKDYFDYDMVDYGFNPKDYRIVTGKYLIRQGIDPNDNANWANS